MSGYRSSNTASAPKSKAPWGLGLKGRLTPTLDSARRFFPAQLPAVRGIFVAALFFRSLGNDGRDCHTISRGIYGHKSQIGGTDMVTLFGAIVLYPNLHAHLHRSAVDAIDRRAQDHEISDANGHEKIQMVNGSGHHVLARVTVSSHGAGEVDPVHEASAKKRVQRIGVVRQHELGHFRDRFAHWPGASELRFVVVNHKIVRREQRSHGREMFADSSLRA